MKGNGPSNDKGGDTAEGVVAEEAVGQAGQVSQVENREFDPLGQEQVCQEFRQFCFDLPINRHSKKAQQSLQLLQLRPALPSQPPSCQPTSPASQLVTTKLLTSAASPLKLLAVLLGTSNIQLVLLLLLQEVTQLPQLHLQGINPLLLLLHQPVPIQGHHLPLHPLQVGTQ